MKCKLCFKWLYIRRCVCTEEQSASLQAAWLTPFPAQRSTPWPLGVLWPSCSASPAALWVVQLELGEARLSGESHSGPKSRRGTVLPRTAAGQKTDWESRLSTSAPETVPSARGPAGRGATEHLSCLTKTVLMQSEAGSNGVCPVLSEVCDHGRFR